MEAPIFTFSEQKRCSSFPEVPSLHFLLLLSHYRDLQIGGSVFRLVKSTTVHVLTPIEKHVVVDIDEVIVNIGLSFDQTKQRKGFSSDVLYDIDFPRAQASLRSRRILLVYDNLESVLEEGEDSGRMRAGYEGFSRV